MSDGANIGVSSERALKTILGGAPPASEDERRTPGQLREFVEQQRGTSGYDATACEACWRVLLTFEARPETKTWPAEIPYEVTCDCDPSNPAPGHFKEHYRPVGPNLYAAVREHTDGIGDMGIADLGLTGFQWGWAVNAAKYIVGAPPVPNPAILTIDVVTSRPLAREHDA